MEETLLQQCLIGSYAQQSILLHLHTDPRL